MLYSLHWLPISFRIKFKILVITFKAIYGLAPQYIIDLIKVKDQSRYNLRSSLELQLSPPSTTTKKTLGDRAFMAAAPKLWNRLPISIRTKNSLASFKNVLKTHLFNKAFL